MEYPKTKKTAWLISQCRAVSLKALNSAAEFDEFVQSILRHFCGGILTDFLAQPTHPRHKAAVSLMADIAVIVHNRSVRMFPGAADAAWDLYWKCWRCRS